MAIVHPRPHYRLERKALKEGFVAIAGVDEAGCAPLAGPVVAAAVMLDPKRTPRGINDSKKLTPEAREDLYGAITAKAQWAVGIGDVARIDTDNILNARLWAMARAVEALGLPPDLVLVDGNRAPGVSCRCRTVIGGDGISLSIAAASIIAKVTSDRLMRALDASARATASPATRATARRPTRRPLPASAPRPTTAAASPPSACCSTPPSPRCRANSRARNRDIPASGMLL
jgi:ribonuclease HII